jgi:hypothetical protein
MAFSRRAVGVLAGGERMMMGMPPRPLFFRRLARNASIAVGVIGGGLFIGMAGYHWIGSLTWGEAFYYSSMILSGEGPPPDPPALTGEALSHLHLFAGVYALFSGVTFITMVGILFAPVLHRFLHRFHLEIYGQEGEGSDGAPPVTD